jgi:hypothetical protein
VGLGEIPPVGGLFQRRRHGISYDIELRHHPTPRHATKKTDNAD